MEKILNFSFRFLKFKFSTKRREEEGEEVWGHKVRFWVAKWSLEAGCCRQFIHNFRISNWQSVYAGITFQLTILQPKKINKKFYMINSYLWMSNKDFKQLLQKCSIFYKHSEHVSSLANICPMPNWHELRGKYWWDVMV